MRKIPIVMLSTCIVATAILGASCNKPMGSSSPASSTTAGASVYDRVMKSQTIKAAYLTYPPALMRDSSGKMTGIFVETLEKAAENLGLKVQWTEEVGWGAQIEGLEADRYDIIGSPVWANPTRGKLTTLTRPVYYSGIGVYVRQGEKRFANALTTINDPKVRISTIDGETGDLIARTQFPTAQRVSLPQNADISQLFLEVNGNKADVLFAEPYFAYKFLEANPNSIKNIAAAQPIRLLGNVFMLKKNESQLKQALDVAIEDLQNSGYIDGLLDKYEPAKNTFYRVAQPFRIAK